jgi:prepilin-type N-terminal cleavage/methylation domain-containing protein
VNGSARGFTLIELLVAMGIMLAVTAAVFAVVNPAQAVFLAQPEAADLQQRLRVAVETLRGDLLTAGAGPTIASPARGPLSRYLAPVMPYRSGDLRADPASGLFHRADTISVVYVPPTSAEARIAVARGSGSALDVETAANCGPVAIPDRVCGFQRGMRVLLVEPGGASATATVASVAGSEMQLHGNFPAASYGSGDAVIAEVATHTYYLKADPRTNTFQLMHYDGHLTDFPVVDNVVALRFAYFGDPFPPALLPGVDLTDRSGPWTTYGPRPPPLDRDDPGDAWPAGENCIFAVVSGAHAPRLGTLVATAGSLATLEAATLTDGPWCPDVTSARRYDADLLRVRRIHVTLRVQAGAASLRGPAGVLFARGGSATADRWVPDLQIEFDVAPRNLNSGR